MPCGLPTHSYFEAILGLAGAVACQCANALEPLGACNASRAANPHFFWIHLVLAMPCRYHFVPCEQSATTLEPFGADIALRAANPQMPWGHLVFVMSCGLPSRRCFDVIWYLNVLRAAIPQMPWGHLVSECPEACHPADVEPFGT